MSNMPEAWRKKFQEWGAAGGHRGDPNKKARATRKQWAPGGVFFHKRKRAQAKPAKIDAALAQIKAA